MKTYFFFNWVFEWYCRYFSWWTCAIYDLQTMSANINKKQKL